MEELELSELALSVLVGAVEGVWAILLVAAQRRAVRLARGKRLRSAETDVAPLKKAA